MFTANVVTPRRKSLRRHRRISDITIARERHPVRIVPTEIDERATGVAWADPDTRHSDFDLATWEDAEWR